MRLYWFAQPASEEVCKAVRQNVVRAIIGVALASTTAAALAGCSDSGKTNEAGSSNCNLKIGTFGAYTGGDSGLVLPSLNAIKMAIEDYNTANPNCKVTEVDSDTTGDQKQAGPVADKFVQDKSVIAVIGGAFSGESKATIPTFDAAGLVMLSQSATATELTASSSKVFHRVVGNDSVQGAAAAQYLKGKYKKAFLINDGSPYGLGISNEVKTGLGSIAGSVDKIQKGQQNYDATISKIKAASPDVVTYAGYTSEAAPLLKQMRTAGIKADFVGFDGLYDPNFIKVAGSAAEGAVITCPCLPPDKATGDFAAKFKAKYGQEPGAYAAEGYDAAQIILNGIKAGKTTRADMLAYVNAYDQPGASKELKFDSKGDVDRSKVTIWPYKVTGGKFVAGDQIKLG